MAHFNNKRAVSEGWKISGEKVGGEIIWSLVPLDDRYVVLNPVDGTQLQSAEMGVRRMIYHAAEKDGSQYHKEALAFLLENAPEIYEAVMFGRSQ